MVMDHPDHAADAFSSIPGQCFRLVMALESGQARAPTHCPHPAAWHERFKDGSNEVAPGVVMQGCSVTTPTESHGTD